MIDLFEEKNINYVCYSPLHSSVLIYITSLYCFYLFYLFYLCFHQVINHVHVLAKHVAHIPSFKGPYMAQEDLLKTRSLFSSNLTLSFVDFNSMLQEGITIRKREWERGQ